MNAADFITWCRLRGFRSPENAATILGLPKAQLPHPEAAKCRVSVRVVLACIGYEYCYEHTPPEPEISRHYALVQQRIRRFLELEPGPRDAELATALVLGLASMVELEQGEQGKRELLRRVYDLISRSPAWDQVTTGLAPMSPGAAGITPRQQNNEKKADLETSQILDDQAGNDNKATGTDGPLIGDLLLLSSAPIRIRNYGDSRLTRARGHERSAAVADWRDRRNRCARTQVTGAQVVSPTDDKEPTRDTAVAACDWRWPIRFACETLQHAIAERPGVFLVTCDARTMLADRLAMRLRGANRIVALDRRPGVSLAGPLAVLSEQLGIRFDGTNRAAWLQLLADTLERRPSIIPVLLIDTADLLSDPAIRELLPVLEAGGNDAKIRTVLIGRPELRARLEQPDMTPVNKRICFRHRLEPLDDSDNRSVIADQMPPDFAIGGVASKDLGFIGDYIRANPDKVASLWPRARLLASHSGERIPGLADVVKAIRMLGGNAGGMAAAITHGDATAGTNTTAYRGSSAVMHKSFPRTAVRAAAAAIIVIVGSAIPFFVGHEHMTPRVTTLEQVASQSVSATSAASGARSPTRPLQAAKLSDLSRGNDEKVATTTPPNAVSRGQPSPALSHTELAAPTRTGGRVEGSDHVEKHSAPNGASQDVRRLTTLSVKPLPSERAVQTGAQPLAHAAPVPTTPAQRAPVPSANDATEFAAASDPTCQPYVSQNDFTGRSTQVAGVACHDAGGRWWLMNQKSSE